MKLLRKDCLKKAGKFWILNFELAGKFSNLGSQNSGHKTHGFLKS